MAVVARVVLVAVETCTPPLQPVVQAAEHAAMQRGQQQHMTVEHDAAGRRQRALLPAAPHGWHAEPTHAGPPVPPARQRCPARLPTRHPRCSGRAARPPAPPHTKRAAPPARWRCWWLVVDVGVEEGDDVLVQMPHPAPVVVQQVTALAAGGVVLQAGQRRMGVWRGGMIRWCHRRSWCSG